MIINPIDLKVGEKLICTSLINKTNPRRTYYHNDNRIKVGQVYKVVLIGVTGEYHISGHTNIPNPMIVEEYKHNFIDKDIISAWWGEFEYAKDGVIYNDKRYGIARFLEELNKEK